MKASLKTLFLSAAILFAFPSCKKETTFLYELDPIAVSQSNGTKNNVKSTLEFISIAYADVFGSNIPTSYLQQLSIVYTAFGDKKLMEDRIIRSFLNDPNAVIPATISVSGDTSQFIINTYKKFFNREPNEFESYYVKNSIKLNSSITPEVVYYAMMTADEYRYY